MNIQIFGRAKCQLSKKAERFFKERRVPFQWIDLQQKGLSKGEFQSVKGAVGLENLIDQNAKDYGTLNLDRIRGAETREDIAFKNQQILKSPIVRNGRLATAGYEPEIWIQWLVGAEK